MIQKNSMENLIIIAIEHVDTWEPNGDGAVEVSLTSDVMPCEPWAASDSASERGESKHPRALKTKVANHSANVECQCEATR